MEALYQELGKRIRGARSDAGLTQAALAKRVGLSRTSITNVEQGNQHLPIHVLFQLATALGVRAQTLLPEESDLQKSPDRNEAEVAKNLSPAARRQVARLLREIPDEERRLVYKVMEGAGLGADEGEDRGASRKTPKRARSSS